MTNLQQDLARIERELIFAKNEAGVLKDRAIDNALAMIRRLQAVTRGRV